MTYLIKLYIRVRETVHVSPNIKVLSSSKKILCGQITLFIYSTISIDQLLEDILENPKTQKF